MLALPNFVLDAQQALALQRIFENPLSIITGPPGSGKTTIIALASLAAAKFYSSEETPIFGVAFAGRAASMLQDTASTPSLEFQASTIHRALGLDADADGLDNPASTRTIEAPVLIIDECSMINSILLAAVLDKTDAEHVALLGDVDQLPPIGAGAPFADMIANGMVPVTRLERNYRTDLAGIQGVARAINDGDLGDVSLFVEMGGLAYHEKTYGERGRVAGAIWRSLVSPRKSKSRRTNPHEIAVITPKKVGDEGTIALNRLIRSELGLTDALQVSDIILVTENNYKAATPNAAETVAIFNGERCTVVERRADTFDALFPGGRGRPERVVRFLHNGDRPPEGTAYGYAMTTHKAQGSQFDHVILVTDRPGLFVSRASVYTAASRARKQLTIVGDEQELAECADRQDKPRRTYLSLITGLSKTKSPPVR